MLLPTRASFSSVAEVQHDLLRAVAAIVMFNGVGERGRLQVRWTAALRALFAIPSRQRELPDVLINEWVVMEDRARLATACEQLCEHGTSLDVSYRVVLQNGESKQLRVAAQAVGADMPRRIVGLVQDCTQLFAAERNLQASQDRLQTVGRLTLLGEVASGLAHELNQPLAAITTFAQAGERLLSLPEPRLEKAQQVFKEVSQQALRAGEIIRRMRALIKRRAAHFETVEAGTLVKEFLSMAEPMAQAQHVQLRELVAVETQRVAVDATQIQQALMVLFQNALDAVKELGPAHAHVKVIAQSNAQGVLFAVEDRGSGLSEAAAAQVFRPFFTTKENGTGLGLISARNIVEAHGSRLEYANLPEGGCRFWFVLPFKE